MEPQDCQEPNEPVTSFMRPAPVYNIDETHLQEDRAVADPLSDQTLGLWQDTARRNREIFTELFRPVPTNLVRSKDSYKVRFSFPKHHLPLGVDGASLFLRIICPM
jgi:phospholipase D1/2